MKGYKTIAQALTGKDAVCVSVGGNRYLVPPPTIERIVLACEALSDITLADNIVYVVDMTLDSRCWAYALSRLVASDDSLADAFLDAPLSEVVDAVEVGMSMVSTAIFDKNIKFDEERSENKSDTIGNATMMGQVATFMENLHLSYDEVYSKIPFRNLLLMQKDKLHVCYGTKISKTSGKDMARRRMAAKEAQEE